MSQPDMQRTTISSEMPNESIIPIDSPEIEEVDYTEDDTGNVERKVLHGSSTNQATGALTHEAVDNGSEMNTEEDGQTPALVHAEDQKPERPLSDEKDLEESMRFRRSANKHTLHVPIVSTEGLTESVGLNTYVTMHQQLLTNTNDKDFIQNPSQTTRLHTTSENTSQQAVPREYKNFNPDMQIREFASYQSLRNSNQAKTPTQARGTKSHTHQARAPAPVRCTKNQTQYPAENRGVVLPREQRRETNHHKNTTQLIAPDDSDIKDMLTTLMSRMQVEHEHTRKQGVEQEKRLTDYVDERQETQQQALIFLEEKLENQFEIIRHERRYELKQILEKMQLLEDTSLRRIELSSLQGLQTTTSQAVPPPFSPTWNKDNSFKNSSFKNSITACSSFISLTGSLPSSTPEMGEGSFTPRHNTTTAKPPCIKQVSQPNLDETSPNTQHPTCRKQEPQDRNFDDRSPEHTTHKTQTEEIFRLQLDDGMHYVLHAWNCTEGRGGQTKSCTDALLDQKGSICCKLCRETVTTTLWAFVQKARQMKDTGFWRDRCPQLSNTWMLIDAWNTGDCDKYEAARELFELRDLEEFRHQRATASDWDLLNSYIWNTLRHAMKSINRISQNNFTNTAEEGTTDETTLNTNTLKTKLPAQNRPKQRTPNKKTRKKKKKKSSETDSTTDNDTTSKDSDETLSDSDTIFKRKRRKQARKGGPSLRTTRSLGLKTKQVNAIAKLFLSCGRKEGESVIAYLTRMRYDQAEDWDTTQYTYLVPRLWGNGQAERKWRQSLPKWMEPIEMERRMVDKYDPDGTLMDSFVARGWCQSPRKQTESCQSYVIRLKETKDMVNAWTREESITQKALLLAVRAGVQSTHMAELMLAETERHRTTGIFQPRQDLAWKRIEELAEYADKMGGIRDGTPKKIFPKEKYPRNKLGQFQRNATAKRTLSFEDPTETELFKDYDSFNTCIRQVSTTDHLAQDEMEIVLQETVRMIRESNEGMAEEICRAIRPVQDLDLHTEMFQIRQVRKFIQPRITELTIADMQREGKMAMVLCRERFLPENAKMILNTICCFESNTTTGCRLHKQGRCRLEHSERQNIICEEAKEGKCMKGGTCRNRHPGDAYDIYLPVRGGKLKKIVIYDRKNSFSKYYKPE